MKARQAVFNVDQHWEAIYHTLYPFFYRNEELHFSIQIDTERRINNYYITELLNYINQIEIISKYADDTVTAENLDHFYKEIASEADITTSTKAFFNSPGAIWTAIRTAAREHPVKSSILIGYILLFGNTKLGFDGLIDLETRHNIIDLLIEAYKNNRIDEVATSLEISKPNINTESLESEANDEKNP